MEGARKLDQFRPSCLCNTVYKILSKRMANRLRLILPKIISKSQGCQGRQIVDCGVLAHEIIHSMKNAGKEKASLSLKLDMAKAYDRLDRGFLMQVLKSFGFGQW